MDPGGPTCVAGPQDKTTLGLSLINKLSKSTLTMDSFQKSPHSATCSDSLSPLELQVEDWELLFSILIAVDSSAIQSIHFVRIT